MRSARPSTSATRQSAGAAPCAGCRAVYRIGAPFGEGPMTWRRGGRRRRGASISTSLRIARIVYCRHGNRAAAGDEASSYDARILRDVFALLAYLVIIIINAATR